jgi:hypothetical protein
MKSCCLSWNLLLKHRIQVLVYLTFLCEWLIFIRCRVDAVEPKYSLMAF